MSKFVVQDEVATALRDFVLPDNIGFGELMAPVMYRVDYADGKWGDRELSAYKQVMMDPAAKVFHYAQVLFEGLKAYKVAVERPRIFRPDMNWQRLIRSAQRMLMPELPKELFMEGLYAVTAACEQIIPDKPGQSLYLRPFMMGTQAALGLKSSNTFSFYVIACPVEPLAVGSLRVLIERENTRGARGGTGHVKVSGNYGASLYSTVKAAEMGFDQPLWLDAMEHRYIEELSVMNFFAIIDSEIMTPALNGTILPGVTRDSVIAIARKEGYAVHETKLDIDELLVSISNGRCTEVFVCGTAAIIAPISALGDTGDKVFELSLPENPVALQLRAKLLDIQEGRVQDDFKWLADIPEEYYQID